MFSSSHILFQVTWKYHLLSSIDNVSWTLNVINNKGENLIWRQVNLKLCGTRPWWSILTNLRFWEYLGIWTFWNVNVSCNSEYPDFDIFRNLKISWHLHTSHNSTLLTVWLEHIQSISYSITCLYFTDPNIRPPSFLSLARLIKFSVSYYFSLKCSLTFSSNLLFSPLSDFEVLLQPFLLSLIHPTCLTHLIPLDIIKTTYRNKGTEFEAAYIELPPASC